MAGVHAAKHFYVFIIKYFPHVHLSVITVHIYLAFRKTNLNVAFARIIFWLFAVEYGRKRHVHGPFLLDLAPLAIARTHIFLTFLLLFLLLV